MSEPLPEKPSREIAVPDEPPPEEQEPGQSIFDEMSASSEEWLERRQSLDDLFADERPSGGARDLGGRLKNRVRKGNVYQAYGDIHLNQGRSQPVDTTHKLTADEIEDLRRTLVSTQSQAELYRLLDTDQLVLLSGPPETGKASTALAALLQWGDDANWILPYEVGSPKPRDWKLESGQGYLLDLADSPRPIDEVITPLRRVGMSAGCRLIVLVSEHVKSSAAPLVDHDPPSSREIFAKHLAVHTSGMDLASEDRQLLEDELRACSLPWQVVELVKQTASAMQSGRAIDEMLSRRIHRMRGKISSDLDKRTPILGRCFMTSIAVLHGLPEPEVSGAALALAERLDEKWRRDHTPRPIRLWEKLPSWLSYVGAEAMLVAGPGNGRVIRLKRPSLAAVMLRVIWEDHPTIRDPLIDWLLWLGGTGSWHTRIRVGHAVGKLATFDFDLVDKRFLHVWTRSRSSRDHQLAALALEAAAENPSLTRRVHVHLRSMTRGTNAEKAISIRAYASSVGLSAPDQALDAFATLVRTQGVKFHQDVAQSVAYLYRVDTAHTILNHLDSWLTRGGPVGHRSTALAFARLAATTLPTPERPHLTILDTHPSLEALWRNALTYEEGGRLLVPEAWDLLLREWLRHYGERPAVREITDRIFSSADGRSAKRALLYLRLWRRQGEISTDLHRHLSQLVPRS